MGDRIDWEHVIEAGYDRELSWVEYRSLPGAQNIGESRYNNIRRSTGSNPARTPTDDRPRSGSSGRLERGWPVRSNVCDSSNLIYGNKTVEVWNECSMRAILVEAHVAALEATMSDITVEVAGVLGPRLTALCGGYKGTSSIYGWLGGHIPSGLDGGKDRRLRLTYELIWTLGRLGLRTPRIAAWFGSVHPALDVTPAYAIRAGRYGAVIAAVCLHQKSLGNYG